MRAFFVSSAKSSLTLIALTIICFPTATRGQQSNHSSIAQQPLITKAIDESSLVVLKGNTHPLARPEFDLGVADGNLPMNRMLLVLKRNDDQERALRKLLDNQQDKHSPSYHKWLTPEKFGEQFGPADSDIQAITAWLQSHGFQVGATKGRSVLEFSGTAAQVEETFHTAIHAYLVNGQQHWANSTDPAIPAALQPAVTGIKTLHNFLKKPAIHIAEQKIPAKLAGKSRVDFTGGTGLHALAPNDYHTIYDEIPALNNGWTGQGITIAVIGRNNLYNGGSDVSDFRSILGVCCGNAPNIIVNGPDPGDAGGGEEAEATLDTSWAGALAPNANIDFVVSGSTNTTDGIDLSETYIIENNLGTVMTESFGFCEAGVTSADAQGISLLAEQAAAQGITYIVSAGDTGAEGCDNLGETTAVGGISVNVLASTPFTVAVGGTMFNEHGQDATYWGTANDNGLGSALTYIPENVWNETCTTQCQTGQPPLAAGAGGASVYFSKPSWQSGVTGTNNDTVRDIPDVSLTAAAHDPYLLCVEGSCQPDSQGNIYFAGVSGTSASAPSFAGIMALINQAQGPQGTANYVLYRLASAQQGAATKCDASNTTTPPNSLCTFNDVTSGNNSVPGQTGYPTGSFTAAKGYDLASGLGSVNISNLINNWSTVTFNPTTTTLDLNGATTAITLNHGDSVSVTAGVAPNSGTTNPTGDVVLYTNTTLAPSTLDLFHLSAGQATGSTSDLPGGTAYNVWAHYAGDTTFAPSDSTPISVTVNPEASTTTLSVQVTDLNGNPLSSPYPFGSLVFVRADVAGKSGHGVPTGSVTFSDKLGPIPPYNPQINPPVAVSSSPSLNSQGNTSIGDAIISFDAGNHSISAVYNGDASFTTSNSSAPVTFTIQPGFVAVSGPTDVTITTPGGSGTTAMGIIASRNFTKAINFTCAGLPTEATCSSTSVSGNGPSNVVVASITVSTVAPHTVSLRSNAQRYYFATLLGMGLPFGLCLVMAPRWRRNSLLALMLLFIAFAVPACGGGGSTQQHQDPGTPAGTYTVTLTATGGSQTQQGAFTLIVQ